MVLLELVEGEAEFLVLFLGGFLEFVAGAVEEGRFWVGLFLVEGVEDVYRDGEVVGGE